MIWYTIIMTNMWMKNLKRIDLNYIGTHKNNMAAAIYDDKLS